MEAAYTAKELCEYFSKYGKVLKVNIRIQDDKIYFCEILFEKPNSVKNVFRNREIKDVIVAGHILKISKAPPLFKNIRSLEEQGEIFRLPKESAVKIFIYLKFKDHLMLFHLHEYFQDVFIKYYKDTCKIVVEKSDEVPVIYYSTLQTALHMVSANVTELNMQNIGNDEFLEIILHELINLKRLTLINFELASGSQKLIISICQLKKLNKLEILNSPLTDENIEILSRIFCVQLEELNLSQCSNLTGEYLCDFTYLKVLKLRACKNLDPNRLIGIFQNCSKLKSVDIMDCPNVVLYIPDYCLLNLESIRFDFDNETEWKKLTGMTYLQEIGVRFHENSLKFFKELITHKKTEQIRVFEFYGNKFCDENIRNIILFNKLQTLEFWHCDLDWDWQSGTWLQLIKFPMLENFIMNPTPGFLSDKTNNNCEIISTIDYFGFTSFLESGKFLKKIKIGYIFAFKKSSFRDLIFFLREKSLKVKIDLRFNLNEYNIDAFEKDHELQHFLEKCHPYVTRVNSNIFLNWRC